MNTVLWLGGGVMAGRRHGSNQASVELYSPRLKIPAVAATRALQRVPTTKRKKTSWAFCSATPESLQSVIDQKWVKDAPLIRESICSVTQMQKKTSTFSICTQL